MFSIVELEERLLVGLTYLTLGNGVLYRHLLFAKFWISYYPPLEIWLQQ